MTPRPSFWTFADSLRAWLDCATDDEVDHVAALVVTEQARRGLTPAAAAPTPSTPGAL